MLITKSIENSFPPTPLTTSLEIKDTVVNLYFFFCVIFFFSFHILMVLPDQMEEAYFTQGREWHQHQPTLTLTLI